MENRQVLIKEIQEEIKNADDTKYRTRLEAVLCVLTGETLKNTAEQFKVSLSSVKVLGKDTKK